MDNKNNNQDKKNNNHDSKNKIIIKDNEIITNGTIKQLSAINDPNVIGIIQNNLNNKISEINALIMVLNQSDKLCQEKIDALIKSGANPDKKINYYGNILSARDIAKKYRKNIIIN